MPRPTLTLIAAVAQNGIIGRDNKLPWHLPADLRHFKELTTGHPVIMGRRTWESLPPKVRPLPGRRNIVVTRNPAYEARGAVVVTSLEDALAAANGDEAFVIGGAELYLAALPLADRLQLTEIDAEFEGDACFPEREPAQWHESARVSNRDDAAGLAYSFACYERTRPPREAG